MKNIVLAFIATMLTLNAFAGDVLTLNNQMSFEGKVTRIRHCEVIFKSNGIRYVIPANDIYTIQFENVNDRVYQDYLRSTADDPQKCLNGSLDAKVYHGKKGGHVLLGILFGPFAIVGTAISNPTPDKGIRTPFLSQHKDQFNDPVYLNCYRRKAKQQLIGMEVLGWAAWIVFALSAGL
jgi:hypothetical protein